jgi:hypothetical protein
MRARTLTWVAKDPMPPASYDHKHIQCPRCTRRWRVRKRVLIRYRKHFFARHG